jgi:choice-of-anchor A domain-containing protein
MRRIGITAAAAALALCAGPARADTLTASQILEGFNAVVYDDASTPSDIEGAALIGGNFSGATVYNNPGSQGQPDGYGALTVFGNTTGNSINIDNGGSAYVGGSEGAQINFNGGGGYIGAPPESIAGFETTLDALSTSLSGLAANSALPPTGNNEVITATPGGNGIAVFNITASQLSQIPSYSIDLNGASTVIFNVSGKSITFGANDESGTTGAKNIIWNFYQAQTVTLDTLIAGTILAAAATVTNENQIDGTLVAESWTGSGELHEYGFDGVLPPPLSVPEPGTLTLLLSGVLACGAALRFKPRAKRATSA